MTKTEYIKAIIGCCNEYPMFRAGVFVMSRRSVFMICDLINTENDSGDHEVRLEGSRGKCIVKFKNGSSLLIALANECNMAGQRFHVALVEDGIRKDIVHDYLAPCMVLKNSNVQFTGIIFA